MGKVELKIVVDSELLARAEALGLPVTAILERALATAVDASNGAADWADRNREAIRDHEARIENYGVFGDDLRRW
jgi:post-segregation antitoxin (ccd killing protein)